LVPLQEYVRSNEKLKEVYNILLEKYPLNNIFFWLDKFSKPAAKNILKDIFGGTKARKIMHHLFAKRDKGFDKAREQVNKHWKEISQDLRFKEYLMYELLTSVGVPYTHDTLIRPNPGTNKNMQEFAYEITSMREVQEIFEKERYYIPIIGINNFNLPFSFVHPAKKDRGYNLKIKRVDEVKSLEDIIESTNKEEYLHLLDKRFPSWRDIVKRVLELNITPSTSQTSRKELVVVKPYEIDKLPEGIKEIMRRREEARLKGDFQLADELREKLVSLGYYPEDPPIRRFK